jgi:hypothetical protein
VVTTVSCAAGKAAFEVFARGNYVGSVKEKEERLITQLKHPAIKEKSTLAFGLHCNLNQRK